MVKGGKGDYQVTGLCFVSLVDFDSDGVDELVVSYYDKSSTANYAGYRVEVWRYDEGAKAIDKIIDANAFHIGNGGFMNLGLATMNGSPVVAACYDTATDSLSSHINEYYSYTDGSLKTRVLKSEAKLPLSRDNKGIYSVDGNEVEQSTYMETLDELSSSCQPLGWTKYTGDNSRDQYYGQRIGFKLTAFSSSDDLNTS